jgi:hypothetical protein
MGGSGSYPNGPGPVPTGGTGSYPQWPGPYPTGTGHLHGPRPFPTAPPNITCSGATLNVLGASLDWWYTETFTYAASTFVTKYAANGTSTGWSIETATTTFDLSSALAQPTCTWTVVYEPYPIYFENGTYVNETLELFEGTCYSTPPPVAASTTILTQSAYSSLNATKGTGSTPDVVITPTPAAVTVPSSAGTFSAGTPFVYFSAYEIISKRAIIPVRGAPSCVETTKVYNMTKPFAFPYQGPNVDGLLEVAAGVTGDVDPAFLSVVSQTAIAGSWVADPTMVIVVEKVFAAQVVPAALSATAFASSTELQTPTATLPPGITTPTSPGTYTIVPPTAIVESSAISLDVPSTSSTSSIQTVVQIVPYHPETFIAHLESSDTTLIVPVTSDVGTITTVISGQEVTATAIQDVTGGGDGSGSGGGSGPGAQVAGGGGSDVSTTIVPFVAHLQSSYVTLDVPVPATETVVTASYSGGIVTATALSGVQQGGGGGGSPASGVGNLVSAVVSAAQPTNAVEVLGNALGNGGSGSGSGGSSGGGSGSGGSSGGGSGGGSSSNNGGSGGESSGSGSGGGGGSSSGNGGSNQNNVGGSGSSSGGSAGQGGAAPVAVITVAGSTATANPTPALVIGGQTVVPGGSPITVGGETISVPASGNAIVVDGTTSALAGAITASTVLNVDGLSVTANPEPAFVIGGQTLQAGGSPITVDDSTLSLAPGATAVVVDGSTSLISQATPGAAGGIPVITVGSRVFTANAATQYSLGPGATLTPGGVVIVSGTTISLAPGATIVVINGQPEILIAPAATAAPGAAANIPLITVGSQVFTANAATQYSLAPGATLTPGGVVTVSGTTISLASGASAVVINGQTETLHAPAITPAPLITIGGTVYQANGGSTYEIGGSILTPGGVITVSGSTICLGPGASQIVVNGITTTLASGGAITPAPQITIAGTVYTATGGSTFGIGGSILTPGGVITVSGTTISLGPGASEIVVNGKTTTLIGGSPTTPNSNRATITAAPVLTINGQAYGAAGDLEYIISGQTLTPGGAITITGPNGVIETIFLNSAANELFSAISGVTGTSFIGNLAAAPSGAPVLTIDGQTHRAVSFGAGSGPTYVIDGQTLTQGGTITINGPNGVETISLDTAGTALIEISSGHTTTSTIPGAYGVAPTSAPILKIDGETFTAVGNGATYIIDGQTLTPGEIETVTISGHTFIISLAPGATLLVIEEEGANGQILTTISETLFPAQGQATVTNILGVGGATAGATVIAGGPSPTGKPETSLQNSASGLALPLSGLCIAFGSFALAVFL